MPIIVRCPNPVCGQNCSVAESVSGGPVRCAKCGKPFVVKSTFDGQTVDTKKSQPSSSANPFPILPAEFGRYRVLQLLGKGGMGAVYLAQDSQLGRQVALKIPFFDAAESTRRIERFVREARSAAALHHPNICTVFDAGQIDGRPFLTMAYIAGTPLEDEIDPDVPMPQLRAAKIARKVALALEHAHRKGVVHRDLKPANVMLADDGEPVVMDFGLAKQVAKVNTNEVKLTHAGGIVGTPSYMSPEQVRGEAQAIGPATDIYSLGVMLFEMLTGNTPYSGSLGVVMGQILSAPVPPVKEFRPDVDARLDAICKKAMAKEPAARFASMADFANALGQYVKAPQSSPPPLPIPPTPLARQASSPTVDHSPFGDLLEATAPIPAAKKAKTRRVVAIALALALLVPLAGWLAVVMLRVETADGTLIVELNDDEVEARIKNGKLILSGPDGKVRYTLTPNDRSKKLEAGPYKIRVEGADGLVLDTPEFTLKKGGQVKVRVTMAPKDVAKNPPALLDPDRKPNDKGFVSLFNGKDLTGWSVEYDDPKVWGVEDGVIVAHGTNTQRLGYLLSDRDYGDFILRLEFKLADHAASGVVLRAVPGELLPHPFGNRLREHPVFMLEDQPERSEVTGTLHWVLDSTHARPNRAAVLSPPGFWNKMEIEVKGRSLHASVNGKPVSDTSLAEGALFKDKTVPALNRQKGRIGLLKSYRMASFRNIEIKELPPSEPGAQGFVPLFNGKDLTGWKTHPKQPGNWRVEKGILTGSGNGVSHFYTTRDDYKDFHLRIEARIIDGGNSGVYFRAPFGPNIPADSKKPEPPSNKPTWIGAYNAKIHAPRFGGLLIDPNPELHRTRETVLRPNEWITFEIIADGNHIVIKVNGQTTSDYTDEQRLHTKGHIVLQQHGPATVVEFRKIEIKELPVPAADPFQPKSVWVGQERTFKITLTVIERKGEKFVARFENGPAIVREINGTIKDGKISWSPKDVRAIKGNAGVDNEGTITSDKDGDFIHFVYRNDKALLGAFTLRLKTGG